MFIGHYAVGFAAKRLAPMLSLGTLFLAVQLADLLWPTLVLLGVEEVRIAPGITAVTPLDFVYYPYSHSLLTLAGWGVLLGAGYAAIRRAGPGAGLVLALGVLSHWVLDVISHRPDMPFGFNGGGRVGLGLWNSLPGTLAVELTLFALGVALYARATIPRDRAGRWSFWALVAFLLVVYLANLFGPPPPSVAAVAWAGHALWLLVLWGYWIDRHREPRPAPARG
jgi:hypothetical protein